MKLQFQRKTDNRGRVSYSARKDGWLFVMTHRINEAQKTYLDIMSDTNTEVSVMIIGPLGSHVRGVTVDILTDDYDLVEHPGFECAGSMCSTTSYVHDGSSPFFSGVLTPGRCEQILAIAHNVNVRAGEKFKPLTPGRVYVRRGERRAAGVPTLADMCLKAHADYAGFRKSYNSRKAA